MKRTAGDEGKRPMLREVQAAPKPSDPNGPSSNSVMVRNKLPRWYGGKGRPEKC